jgi:acetyl-CoA C-acetyltransferase
MLASKSIRTFSSGKISNWGRSVVIVAAKRTPIAPIGGKLSKLKATELSSHTIKAALDSINLKGDQIDEVILGNMLTAGLGQSPARQAALGAGIPISTPAIGVNKAMTSCIKSIVFGAQSIAMGFSDVVVTGGFESMSNAPFLNMAMRRGHPFGQINLVDSIQHDGLTDTFTNTSMGVCAEKIAKDNNISREAQDEYTIASYERLIKTTKDGGFANEIAPIKINDKETITEDEEQKKFIKEKIPQLKPVFDKNGTITAGNASKLSDGAVSLILMSEEKAKALGIKPLAKILGYADAEVNPPDFCVCPTQAVNKVLERVGKRTNDIDYFEIHEAFAMTPLVNMKFLKLDHNRVNLHGGAISMGHPLGMSAARAAVSLMSVLKEKQAKIGLVVSCNGGGGATSMILENLQ